MSGRFRALALVAFLAALVAGCAGERRESPLMRLSAEEALAKGKDFMERKKWFLAREHLSHAFEIEPNSAIGREALLLVADAHFLEGGSQNFIKSESKYRDFQNRFPTSDRAGYVQYQIAASLAKRVRSPDRDQSITREAVVAFEDLIRIFPTSEYVAESRVEIERLRGRLAEAEYIVGKYNYRRGLFVRCGRVCFEAAIARIEGLLEEYPEYEAKDKAYYILAAAALGAGQTEKADLYAEKMRAEYPDSSYVGKLKKAYRRQVKKDRRKKAEPAVETVEGDDDAGDEGDDGDEGGGGDDGEEDGNG